ncbi:hypothetical protein Tco_0692475 [Tanacetum coccineum]
MESAQVGLIRTKEAADLEEVEVQKVRPMRDKAKKKGASSFVRSESSTTGTPALIDQLVHKWTNAASGQFFSRKESPGEYLILKE